MRYGLIGGSAVLASALCTTLAWSGPYLQFEAGILSRDVVAEESDLVRFKFSGEAVSTRLMVRMGVEFWERVDLYFQGGGADLSIRRVAEYEANMTGAFGGGLRFQFNRLPYRYPVAFFIEGSFLRYTTHDPVKIEVKCTSITGCQFNSTRSRFLLRQAEETIELNEYTVMVGARGQIEGMNLYGGIRRSRVDGKYRIHADPNEDFSKEFRAEPDLKGKKNFGIFFGLEFFVVRLEKTALNFEASLFDTNYYRVAIRREF